ncbi:MAG: hypothetical protein V8S08_13630 [Lachnoclostridium sp.]
MGMGNDFWNLYEGKEYEEQVREMEEAAELWNNLEIPEICSRSGGSYGSRRYTD